MKTEKTSETSNKIKKTEKNTGIIKDYKNEKLAKKI